MRACVLKEDEIDGKGVTKKLRSPSPQVHKSTQTICSSRKRTTEQQHRSIDDGQVDGHWKEDTILHLRILSIGNCSPKKMASAAFTAIGLDLGAQKTMIVADDGEIIRTSTGKYE